MRSPILTSLVFVAAFSISVLSVPVPSSYEEVVLSRTLPYSTLEKRTGFNSFGSFPSLAKGGNAQSGNSGNVDGGDVENIGWKIINLAGASTWILLFTSRVNNLLRRVC